MNTRRTPRSAPRQRNQLRIIAGKWRGRRIGFPDLCGLRPTGDRIRETLFNWLAPHLPGAVCLDAFAGSGALGFEALSRGAAEVVFVEQDRDACAQLAANRELLAATGATIVQEAFLPWLARGGLPSFDIVFLDPPFADNLQTLCLEALLASDALHHQSLIYVESPRELPPALPSPWRVHREKVSGAVRYQLLDTGSRAD